MFQDMMLNETFFKTYLDFTFVVDTENKKELLDGLSHQLFENFFQTVKENLQKSKRNCDIRAQIMWYRRHKENYCGGESIFFDLPTENGRLRDYIANIATRDAIFKANSICSILKRSLNYKFRNDGSKERQIIVFLSEKEDDVCAKDMRGLELSNFYSMWEEQVDADNRKERNSRRRRLCLITPCVYPYSEFEVDLENTIRFNIGNECTLAEWKDAFETLADLFCIGFPPI